ncbi:type VII secretion integral membrane protein EccD [Gordonia alkaliphila]|uniref:type VII secretion integral membrane protein EccD n=1 Tax=Gordonia alkaliphila TaxID=1053547 RepID=UPI001FF4A10D|nr:type VII secretion integral membrane protein EccD [Gordonia alkaliphila]MCK0439904.1 type VII secretion integral membrane protein EccD [Gordonia alkaliphila]
MTTIDDAPPAESGTTAAEPELVRLSILGADTQLDVALPTGTVIAALLPDLLDLLRLPAPPVDDPDLIDRLPRWTLARIGAAPFPVEATLAEAGVVDGELLVIVDDGPSAPEALVDDVVDGLAQLAGRHALGWTAETARMLGYGAALAGTLFAVTAGRIAPVSAVVGAAVFGAMALVLLTAAILGTRAGVDPRSTATLSLCATLTAATAGSFAPQPNTAGPALATAGACGLVAALVVHRSTGVGPALHAGLSTLCALGGGAGLIAMATSGNLRSAAAVIAVVAVYVILLAPRTAIAAARLPLPPVPTLAPPLPEQVDNAVVEGVDSVAAIADLALVDLDRFARRAKLAGGYLTGIVLGASVIAAAAAVVVATGWGGSLTSLLLCGTIAVALIARGRTHADRTQSAALIAAGTACLLATLAGSDSVPAMVGGGIGVAAAAFMIGTTADAHEFSPLQRRTLELAEYAVIVAIIPLLLWLLGTYRAIREF